MVLQPQIFVESCECLMSMMFMHVDLRPKSPPFFVKEDLLGTSRTLSPTHIRHPAKCGEAEEWDFRSHLSC